MKWIVTRWNWPGVPYAGKAWEGTGIDSPPAFFLRLVDAQIAAKMLSLSDDVLYVAEEYDKYNPKGGTFEEERQRLEAAIGEANDRVRG